MFYQNKKPFYNKENRENGTKDISDHKLDIVWVNVFILTYLHLGALYGFYLFITGHIQIYTMILSVVIGIASSIAVTGGAHRLWSHRSYKANLPLRIFWAILMTMTFQNSIYDWTRDHRVHHKFSETDADPHNAKRGFFFAHVGWLMVKKHKDVIEKGKTVDISDLEQDAVVMFQKKYYFPLMILGTFVIPAVIPWYFWNESLYYSFYTVSIFRYTFAVNITWSINSAAHLYGTKPYDKNIGPTQNPMAMYISFGEGFHNYHHTFPWDYKAAEFGNDGRNLTTSLIDFFAKIGWASELKTASPELIRKRALRTGDGTWNEDLNHLRRNFPEITPKDNLWGWGDKTMSIEEQKYILGR